MPPQKASRREAVRIGELWKKAIDMGMSEREIICLQKDYSRRELAKVWRLSLGRVSQIRAKAMRKMRHPFRGRLAIELGLSEMLGFSDEDIEKYKNRPIDDMPMYHVLRRRTTIHAIEEEERG